MIILDTNIVSELMKSQPDKAVELWLKNLQSARLTTTAITISEIEFGILRLPDGSRRDELRRRFSILTSTLAVLSFDQDAALIAGACRAIRLARGMPSTASDMMIAGIVMLKNAQFATRNVKDFQALPIEMINPWSV